MILGFDELLQKLEVILSLLTSLGRQTLTPLTQGPSRSNRKPLAPGRFAVTIDQVTLRDRLLRVFSSKVVVVVEPALRDEYHLERPIFRQRAVAPQPPTSASHHGLYSPKIVGTRMTPEARM